MRNAHMHAHKVFYMLFKPTLKRFPTRALHFFSSSCPHYLFLNLFGVFCLEPTEAPTTRRTTTRKTTTTKPTTAPTTKRTTRPTTKRTTRRTTRPTTKPTTRPEIILEGIRKPRGKFTGNHQVKLMLRSKFCLLNKSCDIGKRECKLVEQETSFDERHVVNLSYKRSYLIYKKRRN